MTIRGNILTTAKNLTEGDRNKEYGDPTLQLKLAGKLKSLLRLYRNRDIGPAEWEALEMCCTKLSRIVFGPVPKHDNYVDLAAYAAIAGECALHHQKLLEEQNTED